MITLLPPATSTLDDRASCLGHVRGSSGTGRESFSPSNLASSRKWARLKVLLPLGIATFVFAGCILSNPSSSIPSSEGVKLYGSRITNGLRPWTEMLAPTEPAPPALATVAQSDTPASHDGVDRDSDANSSNVSISALPKLNPPSATNRDTQYLGFLPHSGFHNQRIELQNALLLGKALGRTV